MDRLISLIFTVCIVSQTAEGQEKSTPYNALDSFFKAQNILLQENNRSDSIILPDVYSADFYGDSLVIAHYKESVKTYFQYRIFGYQHRQKVFRWQLLSSKIIFGIVISLVVAGIYFSYLQFRKIMHELPADKAGDNLSTKIAIDAKAGGSIDSRVLGVVILFISLMFFYLYLVYVYPIEEIF